jgi:ketosteroid isomerase-like protein
MKKYIIIALLLSCGIISSAQSKDEKAVGDAVQQLRKAMIDGDSITLMKLTDPSLNYGHSGGHIDTRQEFVHNLASGRSDFVTIDLSEQTISVHGKTAIVRHTLIAATNDGGKPGTVKLHVLLVWQKVKRDWKLLARQAVKLTQ